MGALSLSNRDHLVADADGGVPRDRDGVLHALMRRAALGMQLERALGRFSRVRGHRQVVVDVNRILRPARAPRRVPYIQPATAATMWSSVEAIGGPSLAP